MTSTAVIGLFFREGDEKKGEQSKCDEQIQNKNGVQYAVCMREGKRGEKLVLWPRI